jgi:hypothetical protein
MTGESRSSRPRVRGEAKTWRVVSARRFLRCVPWPPICLDSPQPRLHRSPTRRRSRAAANVARLVLPMGNKAAVDALDSPSGGKVVANASQAGAGDEKTKEIPRATRRSRTGDLLLTKLARRGSVECYSGSLSAAEARCVTSFSPSLSTVRRGVRPSWVELAHTRHTKSGRGPPKSGTSRAGKSTGRAVSTCRAFVLNETAVGRFAPPT